MRYELIGGAGVGAGAGDGAAAAGEAQEGGNVALDRQAAVHPAEEAIAGALPGTLTSPRCRY